ncbi:cell division protein ZapD [Shewanella sp. SNU WT4]|uniref:cell division protein ZapD n=1 Tax=Shewanella sp. SNU WT4 TaxID=2590015 RepID=UPI0011285FC9|nr:cell division protein ZapD [Shewanella sp. SNU WT4]QDF65880.1 cell division protein ZapD [Shewanella sp. SNU WT4]
MSIIFEQPLNEKMRSYLRLDYLAEQLKLSLENDHQHQGFLPLFSLCELTERCDYRSDVIKDIDRHLAAIYEWNQYPDIDNSELASFAADLTLAREQLQKPERLGSFLKQDKFLAALKQRLSMPGASCNFDLPQLHFWLAKSWPQRQQEYQAWCQHFWPLLTPIRIILTLSRANAQFVPHLANRGFYQEQSQGELNLLRVRVPANVSCYPTISGLRNRFSIHFVDFSSQKHTDADIAFDVAYCR